MPRGGWIFAVFLCQGERIAVAGTMHHVNGIKDDNRAKNLDLLKNQSAHAQTEASINKCIPKLLQAGVIRYSRKTHEYLLTDRAT